MIIKKHGLKFLRKVRKNFQIWQKRMYVGTWMLACYLLTISSRIPWKMLGQNLMKHFMIYKTSVNISLNSFKTSWVNLTIQRNISKFFNKFTISLTIKLCDYETIWNKPFKMKKTRMLKIFKILMRSSIIFLWLMDTITLRMNLMMITKSLQNPIKNHQIPKMSLKIQMISTCLQTPINKLHLYTLRSKRYNKNQNVPTLSWITQLTPNTKTRNVLLSLNNMTKILKLRSLHNVTMFLMVKPHWPYTNCQHKISKSVQRIDASTSAV